uniref:Nuclear pore complex protein Nup98-Nup96 n=1 Tax=Melanaphis sacchari TaxID=742174 RepID=A0A2H8TZV3_9HEMI
MFGSGSGAFSGGAGNTSGFGQSAFGKPTAPAVFGQTNTSLFNQTTQSNTGLFGSTAAAPAFGQTPTAQPTFGGFNTGGTSLFGTPTATSASTGGLFGQQNASMGGNTGGGLFGSSNPNTSFGQSKPVGTGFSFGTPVAQQTGNIFGTPQTSTAGTGMFGASTSGTFGATSGFGATSTGGTTIKFNPVTGTDTMVRNGVNQTINTRHQSITVMKEYESKIFEELRFEDYSANRKVGQQGAVGGGIFGSPKTLFSSTTTTSTGLFGANDNKPLFGTTSTTPALGGFGNTGSSNVFGAQNSLFGKPQQTTPAFGTQPSTQPFGMNTAQPNIFGSNTAQTAKPFGVAAPQTNIFGSTAPSTFGTQTTGFGQTSFGQPNQNNLFGQNKPAFGLGSTQTTTGFGFGTNTSTSANGLFGSKPANTGFQMTTPAFGTNNAFGATSTAQPAAGGLFGSNAFNKAPTTSLFNQPTNQSTGVFNNAAKPGGLFGQGTQGTGLFGSSNTSNFNTGGTSFFGSNQPSGIGLFGNSNNVQLSTNQVTQSNQMQLQLDTLKAMPYGDSPLFKRFYKDVSKVDDSSLVRSQSVSLEKFGSYKVSPIPTPKRIPQIRRNFPQFNRKSLFDGLEESPPAMKCRDKVGDNSLLFNVSPRSSCKKLNLKKDYNDSSKLSNGNSMIMHTKPLAKLELYFSNKQVSPEDSSNSVNLSLIEENNTISQLKSNKQNNLNTSKGTEPYETSRNNITDTVVIDNQEPSIDSNTEIEDHPTGIKLRRVGYYTIPPMNELAELMDDDGLCFVDGFTIGRYDYGNVYFPDRFNVAGLDLDTIVHIRHREIIIYQDDEFKPPLGEGLNRKATVTLDRVWPNDKTTKQPITNPDRIAATNFVVKLQRACAKLNTQFVDYRADTGSWVFNVEHFSKYALIDSDDEDEEIIVDRSVESKTLPKPILQKPKTIKSTENISPKQNVMKPLLDLSVGLDRAQLPHQYLLKPNFQLSAVNDLTNDSHIMHYYDINKENSINVTAQLSQHMNLQASKIQCMKASFDDIFYNELELMEQDDDTYGQKDKFEDKLEKILETIPECLISPKTQDNISKSKSLIAPVDNQVSPKFLITKQSNYFK